MKARDLDSKSATRLESPLTWVVEILNAKSYAIDVILESNSLASPDLRLVPWVSHLTVHLLTEKILMRANEKEEGLSRMRLMAALSSLILMCELTKESDQVPE